MFPAFTRLSTPPQNLLPLQYLFGKLNQKHRLARPHPPLGLAGPILAHSMRTHAHSREPRAITHALDDARDVRRAVELAHLARQADVRVDERFVVVEHVLGGVVLGALEGVGGAAEQVAP